MKYCMQIMETPQSAQGKPERGLMVFFIDELEYFTPDELNVSYGFLLGGQPCNGWQKVVSKDDTGERSVVEVRTANIFSVESVKKIIEVNSASFEDTGPEVGSIINNVENNVRLAFMLAGETIARLFQSEVLIEY